MNMETASRADLVAYIAALEAAVAKLQARVRELEARLGSSSPPGMPGLKPHGVSADAPKRPRKRRAQGYARRRSRQPTQQVVHALEQCPQCGSGLVGGTVQRRREVLEIPLVRARVIEHVYLARQCPQCRRRCVPAAGLEQLVVGRQRLGMGLVSLITTLREEGRLPFRTIQWYLRTVYGLHLSQGALVGAVQRVAQVGQPTVRAIQAAVQASAAVNADETGWRESGRNGYVWTFSTPTAQYFVRGGRDKAMVDEALGPAFAGTLITDFYAAYDHYPGLKQRCWAHLLREIDALTHQYPDDAAVQAWALEVQALYTRAKRSVPRPLPERRLDRRCFERQLAALCEPGAADPTAPPRRLCARVLKYLPELFTFVVEPGVPPDNNAAERSLRHLVTARKISGGTRSPEGSDAKMALCTLFGTWRAQGLNPLWTCRQLLRESQA
ncbi:MAG TPA: IS66 family transposase [Chloroflexota bacterium]|nr:IS66 family transposase [Chloroflexota bacterium]